LPGVAAPSFAMASFIERQRASAAMSSLLTTHMRWRGSLQSAATGAPCSAPPADGVHCEARYRLEHKAGCCSWTTTATAMPDGNDDIVRVDLEPTSRHLRVVSTTGRQQLTLPPRWTQRRHQSHHLDLQQDRQ
jgi:type IV fimbrial biogenesis protein FimT